MIFLQKCNKCNAPFSWSELYKIIVRSSKPFKCNNCETEHSITVSGRFTFVFLTLVPAMIFMNFLSPFDNSILTLVIGIFILRLVLCWHLILLSITGDCDALYLS